MLTPSFHYKLDNYSGLIDAPIELVQYGDYQCPHCANALPEVRQLQHTLGGDAMDYCTSADPVADKMLAQAELLYRML